MIPENFHGFGNFFCFKIWMVLIFVVPLHSLSLKIGDEHKKGKSSLKDLHRQK